MNIERPKAAAWPVANPVVTCASASQAVPSNFVADPFLYVKVSFIQFFSLFGNSNHLFRV